MILRFSVLGFACLALACDSTGERAEPKPAARVSPLSSSPGPAAASPTRLSTLPISAYGVTLALDDEAVFLLTSKAAYRFVSGELPHGIALDLGLGPVLTRTAFVFWSNGAIWHAPKQGGAARKLATLPHQPQYFVTSGDDVAWVDLSDTGLYTIQTLDAGKPRVRVSSTGELSALTMVRDAIYFVERPTRASFRVGVVRLRGGEPEYAAEKRGRRPALLSGDERMLYYYSLDDSELRELSLDLTREQVALRGAVCSPIQVSTKIYCGSVEGLFEVSRETHSPRVLVQGRPGSITAIASNRKQVAWVVDVGANQLAVDQLTVSQQP